jgi:hypothetical protein
MYSELNFLWESWLKVKTNNKPEAIINKTQGKDLQSYFELMKAAFLEYYRVLKPGKWMTVEFSNTSAAVWNGIQTAISQAGFVIASVTALDKRQGSFKAVTTPTAVKQDLILSRYKPEEEIEKTVIEDKGSVWVWRFIQDLLLHLPLIRLSQKETTAVLERNPKLLFDRLIIYALSRGRFVPLDSREFQQELAKRFVEREGLYYTAAQAKEYDILREQNKEIKQAPLFISTEEEGVSWLRLKLSDAKISHKRQDLQAEWMQLLSPRKNEVIRELGEILADFFIPAGGGEWRNPTPEEAVRRNQERWERLSVAFEKTLKKIAEEGKLKEARREVILFGVERYFEAGNFAGIQKVCEALPKGYVEETSIYLCITKLPKTAPSGKRWAKKIIVRVII